MKYSVSAFIKAPCFIALILLGNVLAGCSPRPIDAGYEGVAINKPYLFGSNGVNPSPLKTGRYWVWWSTGVELYDVRPIKYPEKFTDLVTADNVPVQFNAYAILSVRAGQTPQLHQRFGHQWYFNKVKEKFRTMCRDFAKTKSVFQLTTDKDSVTQGQELVKEELAKYLHAEHIPVDINDVIIGKITPPADVLEETSHTAAQRQRKLTEIERAKAEQSRKLAEIAKAEADKAYMTSFGMTVRQYIALRHLEIEKEKVDLVKNKKNVHIIMSSGESSGAYPIFNIDKQ